MGFIVKGGGGSGTGTGGTTDHNALTNKNLPNQHTIDAITGLLDELGKRPQTADVNVMINSIINGAPEAYNTLKEIADYIAQDQSAGASILATLGNKVDKEAGKGLSSNDYDNTAKNKVDNLNITQVVDLDAVKNASHTHANTSVLGKIGESAGGNITYNNEIIFKNDADQINNTPAGNVTASNVQAAINELDSKKAPAANPYFTGITTLSGGQLKFPATQIASSDPNTLDDYEEGTWTPVLSGTVTNGTGTYSAQLGKYTKIGNMITIEGSITWSAHTGTGAIIIGGLPFAKSTQTTTPISIIGNNITYSGSLFGVIYAGSASIRVVYGQSNSNSQGLEMDTAGSFLFLASYLA